VTTAVFPAGRSLRPLLRKAVTRAARWLRPVRPVLANLAASPLTAAGLACIDVGVFTASVTAGWIVTGLSLMALEHVLADE